jgi:hypothetical protein
MNGATLPRRRCFRGACRRVVPESDEGRQSKGSRGARAFARRSPRLVASTTAVAERYILKTPKRVSGIGALRAAEMPRPSTMRVSRGRMTPSSHRRAVEK